ncbi:MAG: hypothetical protein LBK27_02835 [Treponema sp.]|nr:hypothetical protein [Treponema sp.]
MGVLLFFTFSPVSLLGESIDPFVMPSARASAMGGAHAALADDFYSLFTNPSAFVGVEEEYSIAELSFNGYGPIFEILDTVMSIDSGLGALDLSGIVGKKGFAAGFDLGGPLALGWVGRGLGLGIFSRFRTDALMSGLTLRPAVLGEMLIVSGYSFRVLEVQDHVLDLGFLGKGFFRGGLKLDAPVFDVEELFDDPLGNEFKTYLGLGLDLGLAYTFARDLTAALVCFDAYSPALISTFSSYRGFQNQEVPVRAYGALKPRLDLGLKYRIRSSFLDRYISRFSVMADYHDFLDLAALIPRNPILNVGLGVELVLLNVLSIRAGIADALPAAGFGLDLTFVKLDFSMYGRELGLDPGFQPVYAMSFGLLFRY